MRGSNNGLDILNLLVVQQLKDANFAIFNVLEAIKPLRHDTLNVIKKENRGCLPEDMDFYARSNFPRGFTQAALLLHRIIDLFIKDRLVMPSKWNTVQQQFQKGGQP